MTHRSLARSQRWLACARLLRLLFLMSQTPHQLLQETLRIAQRAADPTAAIERSWPKALPGSMSILAIGKASTTMLAAALERMQKYGQRVPAPEHVFVTAPPELTAKCVSQPWSQRVFACDHPLPTQRNIDAANACLEWVGSRPRDHVLIVLLSGGGSAHLCLPSEGLSLDDVVRVTRELQRSGADINDLNGVRKHIEQLKGGRLAQACTAKQVFVLVLSDVLGDPLDVISSGPFTPDPTTFADAAAVVAQLSKPNLEPASAHAIDRVHTHLASNTSRKSAETPKGQHELPCPVTHRVLANNQGVVEAVSDHLQSLGIDVFATTSGAGGDAMNAARELAERMAPEAAKRGYGSSEPFAWVIGGEWTVSASGSTGVGGPSQEMALAFAMFAAKHAATGERWSLLAYSTDGVDGPPPSDAAGAIVDNRTVERLKEVGIDAHAALTNHDSYTALSKVGALIKTGPTGTNVNHVVVGLWTPDVPG